MSSRIDDHDDMPPLQQISDSEGEESDYDSYDEQDSTETSEQPMDHSVSSNNPFVSFFGSQSRQLEDNNNDDNDEEMPGLESIPPFIVTPSTSSTVQPSSSAPLSAPTPAARFVASQTSPVPRPRSGNRRARVESDDEGDVDRDRRHPFQRTGTGVGTEASTTPGDNEGAGIQGYAQRFVEAINAAGLNSAHTAATAGSGPLPPNLFSNFVNTTRNAQHNGTAAQGQPNQNHPERLSISIDLGTIPVVIGAGGPGHIHGAQTRAPGPAGPGTATGGPDGTGTGTGDTQGAGRNAEQGAQGHGHAHQGEHFGFAEFLSRMISGIGGNGTGGTGFTFGPGGFFTTTGGAGGAGFGLQELLNSLRGIPEREDPERARRLVDGLEEVPVGLVRRLERLAALGRGLGEETGAVGGDSGCAICWDRLLDPPGEGPEAPEQEEAEEAKPKTEEAETSSSDAEPSASTSTAESSASAGTPSSPKKKEKPKHPRIVSLPCAHVFHAECLIPWFTRPRQTTCPTCRFNIDPENLTATPPRRSQRARGNGQAQSTQQGEQAAEGNAPVEPGILAPPVAPTVVVGGDDGGGGGGHLGFGAPDFDPGQPGGARPTTGLQYFSMPLRGGPADGANGGFGLVGLNIPLGTMTSGPIPVGAMGGGFGLPIGGFSVPLGTMGSIRRAQPSNDGRPSSGAASSGNPAPPSGPSDSDPRESDTASNSRNPESSAPANVSTNARAGDFSNSANARSESASVSGANESASTSNTAAPSTNSTNNPMNTSGTAQVNPNPNPDSNPNPDEQGARNFAQALLRMLGLQNIVDPSQVNIHTGPGVPNTPGNATGGQRNSPAANNSTPPQPAPREGVDNSNTGDTTAGAAPRNQNQNPNGNHHPHGYWSFGVDLVIGTGPPPPGAIHLGGPNPTGDDDEHADNHMDLEDDMEMDMMDMMFEAEDDDGHDDPPIPHFYHHHVHGPEEDDHHGDFGEEMQRMMRAFTGIPVIQGQGHRQQQGQPAGNQGQPAQPRPPGDGAATFGFELPNMPGWHIAGGTGASMGEALRAAFGGIGVMSPQGPTPAPSQRPSSAPAANASTGNASGTGPSQPAVPRPTSTLPDEISRLFGSTPSIRTQNPSRNNAAQTTPSSRPISTLPGEINRLFGNVPPIRPPHPQSAHQRAAAPQPLPAGTVFAPWTRSAGGPVNASTSTNRQNPSATTRSDSAPPAPSGVASSSQNATSSNVAETPSGQRPPRPQGARRRPGLRTADDGQGQMLAHFLQSLSGMPPPPNAPNGAPRPTNLGGGGRLFGAGPSVGTRGATRTPDGNARQERRWTPPPPPGLTLRQRIEKREREAGLRCWDPSCGIGPSDEDPFVEIDEATGRQVGIISSEEGGSSSNEIHHVCEHVFHPSCLVSAQRVALRGADENVIGDKVEVSCPVCRSTGVIAKADWDEGARAV